MNGSNLTYLMKQGAKNLTQNGYMSMAALGVLMACLLLVGSFLMLTLNINSLLGRIEAQNEIVVVLDDHLDQTDLDALRADLITMENVGDVTFVSREEGLSLWLEQLNASEQLYDWLQEDNPLPNTFTVRIESLDELDVTVMEIAGLFGVEKVNAPMEVAEAMAGLRRGVTLVAIAVTALLVCVTIVIISNTIRMAIFTRRKEISIMRYVGATQAFIRLPFLTEGVLLGLVSSSLAFLLLWGGYELVLGWVTVGQMSWMLLLSESLIPFSAVALPLWLGFTAFGVALGTLGSMLFIGKHIPV